MLESKVLLVTYDATNILAFWPHLDLCGEEFTLEFQSACVACFILSVLFL